MRGRQMILFALLLAMVISLTPSVSAVGEEYDGDTVYINDSKAYITATPHTIVGDGWVEFGVTAKTFTGDLNVLFGFNNEYIKPTKAEYYNPHDVQQSYVCSEEFNYTLNPNYFYCNSENGTTIFEHSFDTGNISTQTAYWNENEDWSSLNKETTKISYNSMLEIPSSETPSNCIE